MKKKDITTLEDFREQFKHLTYMVRSEIRKNQLVDLKGFKPSTLTKIPKLTDKFLKEFSEFLKSDKNYFLSDYELVGTTIKRIKYEPFKTQFKCSGKVILENDLREFFDDCDFDVNSTKGIIETMEFYAKSGMLHGFVGNSCPIFVKNKSEIIIGTEYDEETYDNIIPDGYEEWGSVCTDLWWYSMVDYDKFKELSNLSDEKINTEYTVLDLDEGVWELEHYYQISSNAYHSTPYAKIKKIK